MYMCVFDLFVYLLTDLFVFAYLYFISSSVCLFIFKCIIYIYNYVIYLVIDLFMNVFICLFIYIYIYIIPSTTAQALYKSSK